jgi:hypothetical protein
VKRLVIVLLVMAALVIPETHANATTWRHKKCRYESLDGKAGFSTWEVKKTIGCVADKLGLSRDYAFLIAGNESGFNEWARNGSSGACGLYQFYPCSKFPTEVAAVPDWWNISGDAPWYSARAHALAALYLAKRAGWHPWCDFTSYC